MLFTCSKTAFAFFGRAARLSRLAGAAWLGCGFAAFAAAAQQVPNGAAPKAENAAAPNYSLPADMPIPLPKIKPPTAAAPPVLQPLMPPQNTGQKSQTEQESAVSLPQNPPLPSPAPAQENRPAAVPQPEKNAAKPTPAEAEGKTAGGAAAAVNAALDKNADKKPGSAEGEANITLADAQKLAQNLADKFSQIRLMMGEFIQFDARGGTTTGKFYLERPGKILFDYQDSPLRVICDGQTIAVNNRKLRSWSLYELGKSPLSLLLADKINIANGRLLEFTQEPNAMVLVLGDTTGRAKIRMIFDAKTYELKQWTMTDNGQDTTIQIFNAKTDIEFEPNMFNINYYRYPKKR